MIIVIFGPDCSGKDSVRHELSRKMNFEPWIIVRSPICNIVYDELYNRRTQERTEVHFEHIQEMTDLGAIFVYLKTSPEELVRRAEAKSEQHLKTLEDATMQVALYDGAYEIFKNDYFYSVSTDGKTISEVVDSIIEAIGSKI